MIAGSGSLGTLALVATGALRGSKQVVARSVREMVPLPALVFWRWLPAVSLVAWPPLMRAWPEIRLRLGALICGGVVGVGLFSFSLLGAPIKASLWKLDLSTHHAGLGPAAQPAHRRQCHIGNVVRTCARIRRNASHHVQV